MVRPCPIPLRLRMPLPDPLNCNSYKPGCKFTDRFSSTPGTSAFPTGKVSNWP